MPGASANGSFAYTAISKVANAETIKENVLADAVTVATAEGFTKDWDINGEKVTMGVEKN